MINLESVRDGLPVGGIHRVLGILQVTNIIIISHVIIHVLIFNMPDIY